MNFFTSHGVRLAYRVDGPDNAPALVLINSLGTTMHMWDTASRATERRSTYRSL